MRTLKSLRLKQSKVKLKQLLYFFQQELAKAQFAQGKKYFSLPPGHGNILKI